LKNLLALIAFSVLLLVPVGAQQAFAIPVDLELQLLVDVSLSVDAGEFILQRDGWANAFTSPAVLAVINDPGFGGICVQLIYWSGVSEQQVAVDWFVVQDATDAQDLTNAILAAPRPFDGLTFPGLAMAFGFPLFANNGCEGTKLTMDVSGDGAGSAAQSSLSRDFALAAGIDNINGLVILGQPGLFDFYVNNIQGGPDSFTNSVASFADFAAAAEEKIMIEIQPPPFCGDGVVNQPSEQCDPQPPGSLPTANCDIFCQNIIQPICTSDADCNDSNACTTDTCNTTIGVCSNTAIVCDDNDACNGLESCNTATGCVPGTPLVCDDGQFCTLDSCNPATGCVNAPNPDPLCERVGGEFIGVDNSALLVAGFEANALWLLPAIAAIGIGVVVIRRIR